MHTKSLSGNSALSKNTLRAVFVVSLLLLQQLGFNVLLSVGTLGLLYLLLSTTVKFSKHTALIMYVVIFIQTVSMVSFAIKYPIEELFVFREIRIMVLIIVFFILTQRAVYFKVYFNVKLIIQISSTLIFCYMLLETFPGLIGRQLFIPDWLYSSDPGTLAYSYLQQANEHGYALIFRPSAFFTEPSYLGMIVCCLYYITYFLEKDRIVIIARIMMIISILLSASALGVIGLILIIAIWLPTKQKIGVIVALVLAVALLPFVINLVLPDRVALILNGSDESSAIRFLRPFKLIGFNFQQGDFAGIPFSAAPVYYSHRGLFKLGEVPLDNALLNMIINYGFFGFYLLYLLFKRGTYNAKERVLMFIVAFQNGSFFDYPKMFTLLFTFLIVREIDQRSKKAVLNI